MFGKLVRSIILRYVATFKVRKVEAVQYIITTCLKKLYFISDC